MQLVWTSETSGYHLSRGNGRTLCGRVVYRVDTDPARNALALELVTCGTCERAASKA